SDSESSASSDDEASNIELKNLKSKLAENPYDYSSHISLIGKLQSLGELDELRKAREEMSKIYPLSPDLWLSWLRDEMRIAISVEEKKAVKELFERAVEDYLSPEVWLEYVQFAIGISSSEEVRELFERALTATGLHVTFGAVIWEAFREYERILGSSMEGTAKEEQVNRVGALFRRQLACPLQDMDKTFEEYQQWRLNEGKEANVSDEVVKGGYQRAVKDLEDRRGYEDKLLCCQADDERFDTYKMYLEYEKLHGDPGRVSVLFERAITELISTIKIEPIIERIYHRATRNVPWCANIWRQWMRSLEKWNKPLMEIQIKLEQALTAGFSTAEDYRSLWMTFLEYLRRRLDTDNRAEEEKALETIRAAFNRAAEHLAKLFGLAGDPQCTILQFWARTEAIHGKKMDKARQLWADIMSQGHSETAGMWLEYVALEKCCGDTKPLRKLFTKALAAVKDWPETICNAWLDFERDEGSLEQVEFCEAKIKEKMEKRKLPEGKWKDLDAKIAKIEEKHKVSSEKHDKEDVDPQITVFVSNLDYESTEQDIRDALVSVGTITKLKLVKDFRGRNKGFAYVQLSDTKAVSDALKLDRTPVKGRPMFISRCDPDKTTRGTAFKYQCALEKNKLFVKAYGSLKEVRLVTYRNGHSKGLAYVDYKDEGSASKALLATDGMKIEDKEISVAYSQPPERKKPESNSDIPSLLGQIKSLGGSSVARSNPGRQKTMLSMVPRSVVTPSNGVKDKPKSNAEFRSLFLNK
ncbi:hypothetical protein G9C98_000773, partial [Cotesia typhae]